MSDLNFTLYSKADCSLCDKAKVALAHFKSECYFALSVVDITTDSEAFEKYKFDIPVLAINGVEAAKHSISIEKLRVLVKRHAAHK
ncbi:MAG: glutaredoxin family protein [Planctomycetota bacterium]